MGRVFLTLCMEVAGPITLASCFLLAAAVGVITAY